MRQKSYVTLPNALVLLILAVTLMMMGCASGTVKTEAWKFQQETIDAVRTSCKTTFPDATSGTFEKLWENKRSILRQSRSCTEAANVLADQAENRNNVIGK